MLTAVYDHFLGNKIISEELNRVLEEGFTEFIVGEKSFHINFPSKDFDSLIINNLQIIHSAEIDKIFSFIRIATDELDTDWRIHSDLNIMGQRPDRASVLYMSPRVMNDLHGTAFWSHKVYGTSLPPWVTDEEFNRMITSEANEMDQWELRSVIGYEQDRLIDYHANYFHSKYPNKAWEDGRIVYVIFYNFKQK
jgi:hypothetical protein